jgi:hypothetical protein
MVFIEVTQRMAQPATPAKGPSSLAYAAMSLLVVWHTLAMVVVALPDSIAEYARFPFQAYVTLFRLDNKWGFFAPDVNKGYQFRYVIEDAGGSRHTFVPAEKLDKLHPNYIWTLDWYKIVATSPEVYGDAAGAALCREHAALHPVSVTLMELEQKPFWPEDLQAGKHPLDPEFVTLNTLKTVQCPSK